MDIFLELPIDHSILFQEYCEAEGKEKYRAIFPFMLHKLYEEEIAEEDAIWKWVEEGKADEKGKSFVDKVIKSIMIIHV